MQGYVNEILPIKLQLDDGANGLYPRVKILRSSDNFLLDDLSMTPTGLDGMYGATYTPTTTGHLAFQYQVYTSNLYNVLADYVITDDQAFIEDPQDLEGDIAQEVWEYANRTLTEPVEIVGVPDASLLATEQDVIDAKNEIINLLDTWEARGSMSMDKATDSLELIAWLTKNGETVLDASTCNMEIRDSDDNIIATIGTDNSISPVAGLFKFTRGGASAIILKNRTYVMKIIITRGAETYRGNVSINTY
jgi:hypothetical protein